MILYFIRQYIKCHTDIRWLFYMYYLRKFKKLYRFYMEKCNNAPDALSNAISAFKRLYGFDYFSNKEFKERFKELFNEDF